MHMHAHTETDAHTNACTYMHMICAHTHTHKHSYMHICKHTHTHTQTHTWSGRVGPATCGVMTTLGWDHSSLLAGRGSSLNTSSMAPPIHPSLTGQTDRARNVTTVWECLTVNQLLTTHPVWHHQSTPLWQDRQTGHGLWPQCGNV